MGYYRDATPEEVERGEATMWSILPPPGIDDLPWQDRERAIREKGERVNPSIWVEEPMDTWTDPVRLVAEYGYRPEALLRLFGPTETAPDGTQGWTTDHIDHIYDTVIAPAFELLQTSLVDARIHDHLPEPKSPEEWPTRAEAEAAVAQLDLPSKPGTVSTNITA